MNRIYHSFPFDYRNNSGNLLQWATEKYTHVAFLNSNQNNDQDPYALFDCILGIGCEKQIEPKVGQDAFDALKQFTNDYKDWMFGFFSYDLKNQQEELVSLNDDQLNFPLMHFFIPSLLFRFSGDTVEIGVLKQKDDDKTRDNLQDILIEITNQKNVEDEHLSIQVNHKVKRKEYINTVEQIKRHIQQGDIYEMNYCIEFFANNVDLNPVTVYQQLNTLSPTPFSCFYRFDDKFLMSSTPERFLAKREKQLISQPIKGTIGRGQSRSEDERLKQQLFRDPKERSENVMIVDLVRNDLARTARVGSVEVKELFGIYTYPQVHQMISTIISQLDDACHFTDALRAAFPMGSMTGAPKIKAMELIERYEKTRRGLFSGAVGYISPQMDFDFNVVIRSLLYNKTQKYISFMAGSAITSSSDAEKEYQECLLKAQTIAQVLGATLY